MPRRFTCVLLDDDHDFLELEKRYLAESCPDVQVVAFGSGEDAIAYLRVHHVDLIVTDYKMPGMTGVELTRTIRGFDRHVAILVVSENDVKDDALEAGASAFMRKNLFRPNHRAVIDELLLDREATCRRIP